MKFRIPALMAAVIITLSACGGGQQTSDASPVATSASAKPTTTAQPVPDVVGQTYISARSTLNKSDYFARLVGSDGKKWTTNIVPNDSVIVVSMNPVAGKASKDDYIDVTVNMTEQEFLTAVKAKEEAAKAAAEEAKIAARYTYSCDGIMSSTPDHKFYKDVWASTSYKSSSACMVKIGGMSPYDKPTLIPTEQKLIDFVASKGGDIASPGSTIGRIMGLCAKVDTTNYNQQASTPERKADAEAALSVCPDAPHAALLQETVNTIKVASGDKIVGQTMEPGTWKTAPGIKDCYWSRNTGGGEIIVNDFVGFAPDGVTVTVYAGEGFESSRCGIWTKIG